MLHSKALWMAGGTRQDSQEGNLETEKKKKKKTEI
jgi:hypothetical protein